MNWHARINSIAEDHVDAVRRTNDLLDEVEARAQAASSRIGEQIAEEQASQAETREEIAAREAREERDRMIRETQARTRAVMAERQRTSNHHRDDVVLPSDWTDIDEARLDGSGPPDSWLS